MCVNYICVGQFSKIFQTGDALFFSFLSGKNSLASIHICAKADEHENSGFKGLASFLFGRRWLVS